MMAPMDNDKTFNSLSRIPPFSSLPKNELQRVAQSTVIRFYPKETILFVQGRSKLDCIYIIQGGEIELFYEREDGKTQISSMRDGDIFGGVSVLMNAGIAIRTGKVIQDAICYTIPVDIFLGLCGSHGSFNKYFVDAFSRRMIDKSYAAILAFGQAFQFLSGIVPFSFLPDTEIEKIASELSLVFHPKGSMLLTQGVSRIESLYIIRDGAVERYFEEGNQNLLSTFLSEGDVFGGISMLINNSISMRSLKTAEDSHIYIWPKQYFLDVCKKNEPFLDYFTDTFGKRMLDSSYASIVAKTIQPGEEALQFLNQPVGSIYQKDLISCAAGTSIQSAAELMNRHKCSSVFIRSDQGTYVGIVTDNDLRRKVIASGMDIRNSVEQIMSSPLQTISSQALVFEALMTMMQGSLKHLGVTGSDGEVIGIVTNKDILTAQSQSPLFLIREISAAVSIEELKQQHQLLPRVIQSLISNGAKARNITRLITTISDAILNKVIAFAIENMVSLPAVLPLWSWAAKAAKSKPSRQIKTTPSFSRTSPEHRWRPQSYFLRLGEIICTWLNEVGYDFCPGDIMAKNPKWCQPVSVWKTYFLSWLRVAEPDDLLRSTIFFDFRCAYGKSELVDELRGFLISSLSEWSFFFRYMAENAQHFKPPIGFFRNFIVESKGEHRDSFDIKKVMVPIVDFARIYALKHGLSDTNTQERLHQLFLKKKLPWDTYNELEHAYSFLMQLRFARQINAVMVEKTSPIIISIQESLPELNKPCLKRYFPELIPCKKNSIMGFQVKVLY